MAGVTLNACPDPSRKVLQLRAAEGSNLCKLSNSDYAILHSRRLDRQVRCQSRTYLPFEECCKWAQANGSWSSQADWEDWVQQGEGLCAYIPTRPDEFFSFTGEWRGWAHFLRGEEPDDL